MAQPPAGTVTFLFTDIEGSTRLWESATDSMRLALERHDSILRSVIEDNLGYVFATGGDGFAVAFSRVGEALATAEAAQAMFRAESWPEGVEIRVRMAVHTGEASERDGDYFGPAVNLTARLMATAHGGQVVCSASTASLADPSVPLRSLGEHRLRDLAAAQQVFQVGDGSFPPLRSVDVVPTNLPTMRTELIGRTNEVANFTALLEHERLLTLTGVGGVGKTRLALGVAAAVAPNYCRRMLAGRFGPCRGRSRGTESFGGGYRCAGERRPGPHRLHVGAPHAPRAGQLRTCDRRRLGPHRCRARRGTRDRRSCNKSGAIGA